jgi:hypothetical protein
MSDDWSCRKSDFRGIIHQVAQGLIGPFHQGSFVPAVDVREVLGLHDEPYPFDGIEVG